MIQSDRPSSEHCFRLKLVLFSKVGMDGRTDDMCKNNDHYCGSAEGINNRKGDKCTIRDTNLSQVVFVIKKKKKMELTVIDLITMVNLIIHFFYFFTIKITKNWICSHIIVDPLGQPTVTASSDHDFHTCHTSCLSVCTFQKLTQKTNKLHMELLLVGLWIWLRESLMTHVFYILHLSLGIS